VWFEVHAEVLSVSVNFGGVPLAGLEPAACCLGDSCSVP
jgi:hypothetical protein